MNHTIEQKLKSAFMQSYALLLEKMQNDENSDGKIYRLPISWGNTASGQPLQIILEINLNEESFQPLHSIVSFTNSPFTMQHLHIATGPEIAIPEDEAISTLSAD